MESYADYLLVLSPPQHIMDIIDTYKKDAADKTGKYESMYPVPNIAIDDYHRQKPFITDAAIRRLAQNIKQLPPIKLDISGLDYFNHGLDIKTIYAAIPPTPTVTEWLKLLKKILNIKKRIVPHIAIARNIHEDVFNQLWPHYKKVNLDASFTIDKLTVLRKDTFDSFAHWQVFIEIPLEGKQLVTEPPPKHSLLKPLTGNYQANQQIKLF